MIAGNCYKIYTFADRFLLKTLLQYQSLPEGELLSTPSVTCNATAAFTSSSAGVPLLTGGLCLGPSSSGTDEGLPKKLKKERKERGRENGREDGVYGFGCMMLF